MGYLSFEFESGFISNTTNLRYKGVFEEGETIVFQSGRNIGPSHYFKQSKK